MAERVSRDDGRLVPAGFLGEDPTAGFIADMYRRGIDHPRYVPEVARIARSSGRTAAGYIGS
jgi:hypothetical protein